MEKVKKRGKVDSIAEEKGRKKRLRKERRGGRSDEVGEKEVGWEKKERK